MFRYLFLFLLLCSCYSWEEEPVLSAEDDLENGAKEIVFVEETDAQVIEERIQRNLGEMKPSVESNYAFKSYAQERINAAGDYAVIAKIENPSYMGYELSATSVTYSDRWDKVYISYHTNGAPYVGALECYDVSDVNNPQWNYTLYSENLEYNDIHIKNGSLDSKHESLFTAGNTDYDNNSGFAIYHKFPLSSTGAISYETRETKYLEYGTASSVMKYDEYAFLASAGATGKIYPIRRSFDGGYGSWSWSSPEGYSLKYMDNYRGKMGVLTNGAIYLMNVRDNVSTFSTSTYWTKTFDSFSPEDGKNVIRMDDTNIYFSAGSSGVYHYDYDTNDATLNRRVESSVYQNMACGLDIDPYYVYVANASALTVFKRSEPAILYHYKDFEGGSVNYVKAYKDLLFVAAGTSGVYILDKSGNSTDISGVNTRDEFRPSSVNDTDDIDAAYQIFSPDDPFRARFGLATISFTTYYMIFYFETREQKEQWRSLTKYMELYSSSINRDWEQTYRLSQAEEADVWTPFGSMMHYSWEEMGLTPSESAAMVQELVDEGVGVSILDIIFKMEGASN